MHVLCMSLTLEGCFQIHLLKGDSFSALSLNPSLGRVPTSRILWLNVVTASLEASHGPACSLHKWDVEASEKVAIIN